ncbi:MAG TPA: pitrilysin family protein [Gemmatimonadaceae bacterium]|nr:pitrilysin family protein [Gemmatimonadaceae bacterium]
MLVAKPGSRMAEHGVERTVLPNGLTVLSEHVPGVRSIALGSWVRAASLHEPRDRMGVSHLLEHLVFKGTERRSAREIAAALESLGGSLDAYTAREHTSFQARVLDEHLPQAADVLADIVFRPALRGEDLTLERKVVLEEIAMVDDTPDDLVFELHNEALWGDHPYGYSILGTRDTVLELPVDALRALHSRAYHPPQIVIAASGNVEHDELLAALQGAGWLDEPRGPDVSLTSPPPVPAPPSERHVERDSQQVHVVFGSATVPHADPRRYTLMLVNTLLGGGMSSRLFQKIREELGLVYAVYAFQSFHVDTGAHGVYLATAPETAQQAIAAVRAELSLVATAGMHAEELRSGKQQLKGQITLSMESVSSRMYRAAAVELFGEPYAPLDEVLARIDAITQDDVRAACAQFFQPERQTLVSLGPT